MRPKLKDCKIQYGEDLASFLWAPPKRKRNFIDTPKKVVKKKKYFKEAAPISKPKSNSTSVSIEKR